MSAGAADRPERIDGARVMLLELRLGGSLPLHLGAAPRCLLAFEPESAWRAYLDAAPLERRTPSSPTSRTAILGELRAIREQSLVLIVALGCTVGKSRFRPIWDSARARRQ